MNARFGAAFVVVIFFAGWAFCQQDATVYLTGKMLLEDGTPVPPGLRVELFCSGKVIRQDHPSKTGSFSFDLGSRQPSETVSDSRVSGINVGGVVPGGSRNVSSTYGVGTTLTGRIDLKGCVVRLQPTAGYTGTEIDLGSRNLLDKPDVGIVVVRALGEDEEEPTVRAALLAAPPAALKSFEKARQELARPKVNHKRALKELEKAVSEYPEFVEAWHLLGDTYFSLNEIEKARGAFQRGIAAEDSYFPLHLGLAQIELEQSHWAEAARSSHRVLELNPDNRAALFFNGLAEYYLEEMDAAGQSLGRLRELGQLESFPVGVLHLGMIFARQGKIPEAAVLFQEYLESTPPGQVPAARREKLEAQLKLWESKGLLPSSRTP